MALRRRRALFAVAAVSLFGAVLFCESTGVNAAPARILRHEVLPSLAPGSSDIPMTAILWDSNTNANGFRTHYRTLPAASVMRLVWFGRPSRHPGKVTASSDIEVIVALAATSEAAAAAAQAELKNVAAVIPEVTANKSWAFADRVWFHCDAHSGRIVLTRGNAIVDIHMFNREALNEVQFVALARRVAQKIDAALAGKPEPPAVLPPSATEMGLELEDAWSLNDIAKLLGSRVTAIALKNGKNPARVIPACETGKKDYLVPLGHVVAVMGSRNGVSIDKGRATAMLAGKLVSIVNGKSEITVAGRKYHLSSKPVFKGKQVFVPISAVEKVLGRNIKRKKTGKLIIAEV